MKWKFDNNDKNVKYTCPHGTVFKDPDHKLCAAGKLVKTVSVFKIISLHKKEWNGSSTIAQNDKYLKDFWHTETLKHFVIDTKCKLSK